MKSRRSAYAALLTGALFLPAMAALAADPICKPPADNNWTAWLDRQERAGGHAKRCHLGVQASGLIGRIGDRGGNVTGVCAQSGFASGWSSASVLINAIKPSIVARWTEATTPGAGNVALNGSGTTTLGTTASVYDGKPDRNRSACGTKKGYVCKDAKAWRAYIARDANGGCHLVTAFPE